jgi:hypothetical protein
MEREKEERSEVFESCCTFQTPDFKSEKKNKTKQNKTKQNKTKQNKQTLSIK